MLSPKMIRTSWANCESGGRPMRLPQSTPVMAKVAVAASSIVISFETSKVFMALSGPFNRAWSFRVGSPGRPVMSGERPEQKRRAGCEHGCCQRKGSAAVGHAQVSSAQHHGAETRTCAYEVSLH